VIGSVRMDNLKILLLALLLSGCGIYEAHEAKKNNAAVLAQMKADMLQCALNPQLTTHVARAKCENAVTMSAAERLIPPQQVTMLRVNALKLRLAEQLDAGEITPGQAQEQMAALVAQIQAEEREASFEQQRIEAQQRPQTIFLYNVPW
jgi:enhancing lycopene biosynthesis protein 2